MSKVIDELYNLGYPVFTNQWTFKDITGLINLSNPLQYSVRSIDLPDLFPTFETENLPTGQPYYTKASVDKTWSISLEETSDLTTLDYFVKWSNKIFDVENFNFTLDNDYSKDFLIEVMSPSELNAITSAEILAGRATDWAVKAADNFVYSALGRLTRKAKEIIGEGISDSGAGVTVLQRTMSASTDLIKDTLGSVVSGGLDLLKTDKTYHIENPLISFTMKGTILREIEKVALDYTSDDTVKWKVNLASDLIEINFNGQEITI